MNLDNFISFSIVNGFFIGLVVSILKFDSAEMITLFTIFVTIIFYLIMLLSSSLFLKYYDFKKATIHKEKYDEVLEFYIKEFEKREKIGDKIREFIRYIEQTSDEEDIPIDDKKNQKTKK